MCKCRVTRAIVQLLLIILTVCIFESRSDAHGEIVFSARNYLPPGSKGESHYHIYRIDPDGSRRIQLTFGGSDDYSPVWIESGYAIRFSRYTHSSMTSFSMEMSPDGSGIHRVSDKPKAPAPWAYPPLRSPDGKYECRPDQDQSHDDIVDLSDQTVVGKVDWYPVVIWTSDDKFSEVLYNESFDSKTGNLGTKYEYVVYDVHGKQKSDIALRDTTVKDKIYSAQLQWCVNFGWVSKITPDQWVPGSYFVTMMGHQESLYWFCPSRKEIRFISSAMSQSWSPDRTQLCASVFLGPMPYEHRKDGTIRTVDTSFLAIINPRTLRVKYIQSGHVCCMGGDWRGGSSAERW